MKASYFTRLHLRSRHRATLLALVSALLVAVTAHACPPGSADVGACNRGPHCCRRCAPGHYSADGVSCLTCGPDTIASQFASSFCTSCPFPLMANANHTACVGRALPNATAPGLLESSPAIPRQGQTSTGTPLRGGGPPGGARGPASIR